jgi:ubiquinone/menaquinone biosynthesis C-methylase UbiE
MDFPAERDRAWQIWDRLAEWWDATIGDGNVTQDLVEPIIERLLEPVPGLRILDVACGAGRMARRLADRGAVITAVDASERFLERARQRSAGYEDRITFSRVDATDVDSLVSLGERRFDAAVATFALMDMAEITPLATALARLLRPDGSFVLTITHPVFNSGDFRPAVESYEEGTEIKLRYAVSVADYLEPRVLPGLGISGQPEQALYFHRPLGGLLSVFFEQGFVLDALEEPAYPEVSPMAGPVSQTRFRYTPWNLIARLRLLAPPAGS